MRGSNDNHAKNPRPAAVWSLAWLLLFLPILPVASAEVTPPGLSPVTGAVGNITAGALVLQQATVTYVFTVRGISEEAVATAASELPDALVIPVSAVNELLMASAGYVVVVVEFTGDARGSAEKAVHDESLELIRFIEREFFLDADLNDGDTEACVDVACSFVRFDGPFRVALTNGGDRVLLVDTNCGTGDTDCDGETTLFELMTGGNPLDPDA